MKRILLALIIIAFLFQNSSFGNNNDITGGWCGTKAPSDNWENAFQREVANYMLNHYSGRNSNVPISIPIIVHVVYYSNTAAQNISKAQIDSQIVVLNRDYSGTSYYYNNIPAAFKPLVSNTNITWCPAKVGMNGTLLPEYGIDRVDGRALGFPNPNLTGGWSKAYIDETVKPLTIWNPDYYCNVWIVPRMQGGIIGYATFPTNTTLDGLGGGNATSTTDGVVIAAFAYGKGGSTVAPYNQGGTAAHELGHWLGLRHISGDAACGNDYCDDTPPQSGGNSGGQNGLNYGCATFPFHANGCSGTTGPNGEMYMNYMDYSDDNCTSMFTNDQKTRMQTTMTFGDRRQTLLSSTMCDTVIPAPVADFISTLQNAALCVSSRSFNFTDKSIFGATTWSWSFSGGTPTTSNVKNPTGIVFTTAGLHTVTLTVTSPRGTSTISKEINVPIIGSATLPLQEDFEGNDFPPVGWNFVNRNGNMNINWESISGFSAWGIGSKCMRFDNTSLDARGFDDDIVTPKLNFTGISTSNLKFDVAYAPYYDGSTSIFDTLEVYITDNCESTVQRIYTKGGTVLATSLPGIGSEFYPTATEWRTDSVAIPVAYLNKPNVQIIFRNLGNYGHTIYVDNVNISIPASTPTASFTLTDTIICQNSSITFTNTSTGSPDSVRWTINGGTPNTSTSATTVSSTFNTSGSYTVSLTIYKSGTAYGPYTKTITVKLKPTVTATTPNTTICSGNAAVLTGGGATTYSWNTGATTNTISVSPTTTTTYTVTGSTNGCSNTATLTLNVNTTPTVTATPSASSICSGTSVTITGGGATTYSWNTGATTNAISVSPTTTTTYTVTGTSNGCPNTATTTISVNTTPTVTATPSASAICSGTSVTITGGGATTYSWNTGATGGTLSVSPTTTTTYTVTGTSNGCSSTASTTINVTARPTVTATPTASSICSGNSVTINGGGATTYSWNTGATSSSISVSPTTTTTYTVTGTANGCTNTATTTINVNQTPTVNVNNPSICAGASTTLTATGATTYSWNTGATTASISVSPTTTTTYTVTGTANGCTRTVNATVTVNTTAPTVTLNSTTPSICQGESITLTANGADNYSWNTGATSNSITVTPSTTTTYTVNGTLSGCSTAGTATATVNVKPKPTVVVNSTSICTGESATITGSGATTYSWNTGATTAGITVSPTTTTTYTVTGTTNGCSNTATSTITVKSLPTVTVNNPTICAGSSATLTAAGAANYSWNTGATTNAITVSPTTTTTYTVTGTGSNGCARTVNATVNVNSTTPTVTLNNTTVSVCNGTGVTLTASGADNYTWSTGATGSSITFTPTTNGTVSVNGTLAGCSTPGTATASITVKPNPTVGINNASGSICAGSSATLGGTGADTYVWNTGATTNSISVSPTTTTTYSVTGTTNGCIGTASTTVVVNALPSTAIGTSAASICSGQSATLTGSGADTYAWNTGATSTSISVSPTTTTTYTLTGTSNGCSKTATQTISVNATPAQATITQNTGRDTLYCSTVVAGATYNWYLNGSTTPIVTGTPWIKITQSGSYTVEVISSGCTSALSSAFAGIYTAIRVNSNTIRAWEVYPNPTDGRLLLNLSLVKQAEVSISIYNAVGSEVYVKSYGNVKDINDEVRLDNLAKGVYIIKMNVENETFYHKVVKN